MADYSTRVKWVGGHRGVLSCSNGAELPFSAPAQLHGEPDVLTPEDAFVGALNACYTLMFIWAMEKLQIELVDYECEVIGHVEEFLDRTSTFSGMTVKPKIVVRGTSEAKVRRALKLAEKYSLVWQSIKAEVSLKPVIEIL